MNKFWTNKTKAARVRVFDTPANLRRMVGLYRAWLKDNPVTLAGRKQEHPFTVAGLSFFARCDTSILQVLPMCKTDSKTDIEFNKIVANIHKKAKLGETKKDSLNSLIQPK